MIRNVVAFASLLLSTTTLAVTTEDFGSWSLLCNEQSTCTLSQVVAKDKDASQIIMGVNVDYSYSPDFPVLKIKLPSNTMVDNGVGIKIDDNKAIQVPFSGCDELTCQSIVKIDSTMLDELQNGHSMLVAYQKSASFQMTLPVSLDGFADAFPKLQK